LDEFHGDEFELGDSIEEIKNNKSSQEIEEEDKH
jgi:hypothetical protein